MTDCRIDHGEAGAIPRALCRMCGVWKPWTPKGHSVAVSVASEAYPKPGRDVPKSMDAGAWALWAELEEAKRNKKTEALARLNAFNASPEGKERARVRAAVRQRTKKIKRTFTKRKRISK